MLEYIPRERLSDALTALLREFERAGFSHVRFKTFPLPVRYMGVWRHVIEAWN